MTVGHRAYQFATYGAFRQQTWVSAAILLANGELESERIMSVVAREYGDSRVSGFLEHYETPLAATLQPSRVEIDVAALANNSRLLKAHVGDVVSIMAVVKADAYGHGAATVAKSAIANGADSLAVANLAEALELRRVGLDAPILTLSYVPAESVPLAIENDITLSLYDVPLAWQFNAAAMRLGFPLTVHIKVDTGMGRLGILPADLPYLLRQLPMLDFLLVDGIYTHLSVADEDEAYTARQLRTFESALHSAKQAGCRFRTVHASNSAAIIGCRAGGLNTVRPGLLLYGLHPSAARDMIPSLRPAMSWKTVVAQVKTLPANSPIGYGNGYRTRGEETIAVLPIGYADGLRRSPQTWREVLIRGTRAPLVGRVSMEKTTVNVSHISGVQAGDEVVLLGKQGDDEISADEIADWLGTINYEVVTSISARNPRVVRSAVE